jgi:sugar phosphate isomerase/epimerase
MKIALCNEVLKEKSFAEQCRYAAQLGYHGLEVAPFTLSDEPHRISASERRELRSQAEGEGIEITGLHWLLLTPEGLSITSPEDAVRSRTADFLKALVELCADLGGSVLVHGSPKQRQLLEDDSPPEAFSRVTNLFSVVAPVAEKAGITYCIEPLTRQETNFINCLEDANRLVGAVGSPAFRSMLDVKAALGGEQESLLDVIDRWYPTGLLAHVHLNDVNLRAPGQGNVQFHPILKRLQLQGYDGVVSVEPFDYYPEGTAAAARAMGYLQGILEALELENPLSEKGGDDAGC